MQKLEKAVCPFSVVINSREREPYRFQNMKERGPKKRPLTIPKLRRPLWTENTRAIDIKGDTYQIGLADYTIEGLEQQVQIERKTLADLFGALGVRRFCFEAQIKRLHEDCQYAEVVIEGDWSAICHWTGHGPTPQSVIGTIKAWQQRYHNVHWNLYRDRESAEQFTFRALERFWIDRQKQTALQGRGDWG